MHSNHKPQHLEIPSVKIAHIFLHQAFLHEEIYRFPINLVNKFKKNEDYFYSSLVFSGFVLEFIKS